MRFRGLLCRTNVHKLLYPQFTLQTRTLSISHYSQSPKGFGNFQGKDTKKSAKSGRRRRDSTNNEKQEESTKVDEPAKSDEPAEEKPKDSKTQEFSFQKTFSFGGGSNDPDEPKKPKKKKTGSNAGPLDNYDFEGDPKSQWQFLALLGFIALSYLYEKDFLQAHKEVGYNQFLNELKKGSVEILQVVNKEYALFKTRSGIEMFKFPIGSIDQLEDALRRVQDANEIPYENRIAIQYKTTTRPFTILLNNIFFLLIAGYFLFTRAKRGTNPMSGPMEYRF